MSLEKSMKDCMPSNFDLVDEEVVRDNSSASLVKAVENDAEIVIIHPTDVKKKSSVPLATFNLLNTIIGGGIITLPLVMGAAGLPLGIVLLIVCAIVTYHSIMLLINAGIRSAKHTYQEVGRAAFGRVGKYLVSSCQLMFGFIAMIAYGLTVADNITNVMAFFFPNWPLATSRFLMLGISMLAVVLPFALCRNISFLDKASLLSIICVLFYSIAILIRAFTLNIGIVRNTASMTNVTREVLQSLGVIAFAYLCNPNVLPIYHSMKSASPAKFGHVARSSIVASLTLYILVAVSGYYTFMDKLEGNLLNNYCQDDHLANAARLIFAATLLLTYPIQCYATREVLVGLLLPNNPKSSVGHVLVTLVLLGTCYVISSSITCLGTVVEVAGCLSAAPLVFVFPALFDMKLSGDMSFKPNTVRRCISWMMVMSGITIMTLGTVMAVMNTTECKVVKRHQPWCTAALGPSLRNTTVTA